MKNRKYVEKISHEIYTYKALTFIHTGTYNRNLELFKSYACKKRINQAKRKVIQKTDIKQPKQG